MNVLIQLSHPAHFHLYKIVAQNLLADGHQVLFVMKAKLTLRCAPEYVVFMVVSSFMLSDLLAYVFYRPAECLKRAVFGPYNESTSRSR